MCTYVSMGTIGPMNKSASDARARSRRSGPRSWRPENIVDKNASERNVFAFGVFFVGSTALASVLAVLDLGFTVRSTSGAIISAAMIISYFAYGQQAVRCYDERRGGIYLSLLIPSAGGLFIIHPAFMACLFGLFPLCFVMLERRRNQAFAAAGLSLAILFANLAWENWSAAGFLAGSLLGAMSLVFALLMGFWIEKIIEESRGRQRLIEELTATREELARSQHIAGVRDERQRMSAEIHDTLAQGLGSILMLVRGANSLIGVDDARARSLLSSAEVAAQENLNEARALVEDLAPAPLQEQSLVQAIERIAQRFQTESCALTDVVVHGTPTRLEPGHEVVLLRAVQESLTNVSKHAGATRVTVSLHYDCAPVRATIIDDGMGFDAESPSAFGRGLNGIATRLDSVGGSFTINSTPGEGTEVQVSLA